MPKVDKGLERRAKLKESGAGELGSYKSNAAKLGYMEARRIEQDKLRDRPRPKQGGRNSRKKYLDENT